MDASFKVNCLPRANYLEFRVSGDISLDKLKTMIDQVINESNNRTCSLVLLDMLEIGPIPSEMDKFYIGEYAALNAFPGLKVAVIYPKQFTTRFSEDTAVNRGLNLRIFGEESDALDWLLNAE